MIWQRAYKLTLGNAKEAKEISKLRVSFKIDKTITSEPNYAEISIYNLNEESKKLLKEKVYDAIQLEAGYEGDLGLIFSGEIISFTTKKDSCDLITILKCSDAQTLYNSKAYFALNEGANEEDLLRTILDKNKIETGSIKLNSNKVFSKSKIVAGNIKDILDTVAKNNNSYWYFQEGKLNFSPKVDFKAGMGYELSQESGLIGSPEATEEGLEVTSLLRHDFSIDASVRIVSIFEEYNDDYRIIKLQHEGDIMSEVWHSKMLLSR